MRVPAILVAALAAIALGVGATGAVAAERPSLADDIAARLGVTPAQLRAAVRAALVARVDAAVKAGRLTPEQGARLKARIAKANGLALGRLAGKRTGLADRIAKAAKAPGPVATYLGMTREALRAELRKGQSLAQIARARGKSVDGLVAAMAGPAKEALAKAVANGRLNRQHADALLERITDTIERVVQRSFAPHGA